MRWEGKKILNNLVIPLRAEASKQISGIFQLFINGKCSPHQQFPTEGFAFAFLFFLIIFTRKPEMTLLISA